MNSFLFAWSMFWLLVAIFFLLVTIRNLRRQVASVETLLRQHGIDPHAAHEIENLHLYGKTPEGHCGCCQRELEEDESKLSLTAMDDDGVAIFQVCRWCLSEHAPNMLAVLESESAAVEEDPDDDD